ncbi:hypothetical protein fugu_012332 [Takifugu bimaculatus]|uniref:Uncharacterized protein n=1 Tax=Takifugu bimaculatus TaxID=433685 RepID=A0A4Z2C4G6_9TELE|nr:hypothetical protein fugu_012332 [Takifugu bimaculatus]
MNSNAIKNLPADFASKVVDTVSPSPRTSPPGGTGHKSVDALQSSGVCTVDGDCGGDEFCNDAKGACLPCRKSRKRCARDSMCCAGNRCSNGVCQANDIDGADAQITTGWHRHNNTKEHHTKKPPPAQGNQPNAMKGMEGDTCLRSADCSEGLCCARHFWSRICKPVLTEGQVCTRHRRKGTHGLELFQRCDCGEGMTCRPERGERDHSMRQSEQIHEQDEAQMKGQMLCTHREICVIWLDERHGRAHLRERHVRVLGACASEKRNTMLTIHHCGMTFSMGEQCRELLLSLGNNGSTKDDSFKLKVGSV